MVRRDLWGRFWLRLSSARTPSETFPLPIRSRACLSSCEREIENLEIVIKNPFFYHTANTRTPRTPIWPQIIQRCSWCSKKRCSRCSIEFCNGFDQPEGLFCCKKRQKVGVRIGEVGHDITISDGRANPNEKSLPNQNKNLIESDPSFLHREVSDSDINRVD